MAQKFIGLRGIDPLLYEKALDIVKAKYGSLRNKHSNVAREINELLRLYVETGGDVVARTHKSPKEQILDEIDGEVSAGRMNRERLERLLDDNHIVDERARENYTQYARRVQDDLVARQLGITRDELRKRRNESEKLGYG